MKNRREFLQLGIAASTLPLSGGVIPVLAASAKTQPVPIPLYKIIYDIRFPASRAFASHAQRLGEQIDGIEGDITGLWYYDLYDQWQQGPPAAIAGLTAEEPLFCLERLAGDARMRVVFRAAHTCLPDGRVEHVLSGSELVLNQAVNLRDSGLAWTSQIADLVTCYPHSRKCVLQRKIVTSRASHADDDPEQLFSWVIAPVDHT